MMKLFYSSFHDLLPFVSIIHYYSHGIPRIPLITLSFPFLFEKLRYKKKKKYIYNSSSFLVSRCLLQSFMSNFHSHCIPHIPLTLPLQTLCSIPHTLLGKEIEKKKSLASSFPVSQCSPISLTVSQASSAPPFRSSAQKAP